MWSHSCIGGNNIDTRSCLNDAGYYRAWRTSYLLLFSALTWSRKSRSVVWVHWRRMGYMPLYLVGHFWLIWYFDHFYFCFVSRRRETWGFERGANLVSRFHLMRLYLPGWSLNLKEKKKVFLFAFLLYRYTLTQVCSNPFANRDYIGVLFSLISFNNIIFRSGVMSLS